MRKEIKIMGILNVTPDSFYDEGRFYDTKLAIDRAFEMAEEGAHIIDIGGESTRPGSKPVPAAEEIDRVVPVIEALSRSLDIPISIDTNKSAVAEEALRSGASIVNDISGLTFDENMIETVAKHNAEVIIMHIQGTPETMQNNPNYDNLIEEIICFLKNARERAVRGGIDSKKIIVDPGIGFGKTLEDNYAIINNIEKIKSIGAPVLIGLSRKSLIGKLYDDNSDRLPATIALNAVSIFNGADIIRVHDVKEHRLILKSMEMLMNLR